jgi:hypothetical protein
MVYFLENPTFRVWYLYIWSMTVELFTVPSLDVLGLAELHQHLGGGMDHVHLVQDGGAVVRNRHLAFRILTKIKNNQPT